MGATRRNQHMGNPNPIQVKGHTQPEKLCASERVDVERRNSLVPTEKGKKSTNRHVFFVPVCTMSLLLRGSHPTGKDIM